MTDATIDTRKTPAAYSLEDAGLDTPSTWPGAGTAFTEWDEAIQGIGSTPREAREDALEQAAHTWNVDKIKNWHDDDDDEAYTSDLHAEDCPAANRDCTCPEDAEEHAEDCPEVSEPDCDGECDAQYNAILYLRETPRPEDRPRKVKGPQRRATTRRLNWQ